MYPPGTGRRTDVRSTGARERARLCAERAARSNLCRRMGGIVFSARFVGDWGQGIRAITSTQPEVQGADPGLQPPAGEPRRGGERTFDACDWPLLHGR